MDESNLEKLRRIKELREAIARAEQDLAYAQSARYRADPVLWCRERLGEFLWSKQREIAESVRDHRRTAVQSCHDSGKSFLASRMAAWWIDVHPPGEALVVSTAPTYQQVHAILWEELRKAAKKAARRGKPLPGKINLSDQWTLDDELVGLGRKPADHDEHGFHGLHRKYVLVIIDEACGVPAQLWTAVEAITTNQHCRILAIGNPDDPATEFGNVCKPGSGWANIRINGEETPNLSGEDVPDELRPLLLDADWVQDKKTRWGIDSPTYQSKVLGLFPAVGDNILIQPGWIRAAQERTLDPGPRSILSVDVARYGTDRTVLALRRGPVARIIADYGWQDTMATTGRVVVAKATHNVDEIRVDGVGVGGGVVDRLLELGHDVLDMQAGGGARDPEHYLNARAEWYWALRRLFETGLIDIDPADDQLAAQLGSIRYKIKSDGKIQIESKDEMKKRKLPSPDRADAVMLGAAATPIVDQIVEDEADAAPEGSISPY